MESIVLREPSQDFQSIFLTPFSLIISIVILNGLRFIFWETHFPFYWMNYLIIILQFSSIKLLGNFSRVTAIFVLERRTGYFFLHLYAPCALIVMISWISFCIPKDSTAARVALGITSVLTITTILNMLNTAMPKVCLNFVFLSV